MLGTGTGTGTSRQQLKRDDATTSESRVRLHKLYGTLTDISA